MPKVEALAEWINHARRVATTVASLKSAPVLLWGRPAAPLSGGAIYS
jgi:hypothetical protein